MNVFLERCGVGLTHRSTHRPRTVAADDPYEAEAVVAVADVVADFVVTACAGGADSAWLMLTERVNCGQADSDEVADGADVPLYSRQHRKPRSFPKHVEMIHCVETWSV